MTVFLAKPFMKQFSFGAGRKVKARSLLGSFKTGVETVNAPGCSCDANHRRHWLTPEERQPPYSESHARYLENTQQKGKVIVLFLSSFFASKTHEGKMTGRALSQVRSGWFQRLYWAYRNLQYTSQQERQPCHVSQSGRTAQWLGVLAMVPDLWVQFPPASWPDYLTLQGVSLPVCRVGVIISRCVD